MGTVERVFVAEPKTAFVQARFDFLNPRINDPVPASAFAFTPPLGTSIIRP